MPDLDHTKSTIRVERSLEETKAGLKLKDPNTRHGKQTVTLPENTMKVLRTHWLGKPEPEALILCRPDGSPIVIFHKRRPSHASALIASRLDLLTIARRLGHGNPVVTLTTYAHLFGKTDSTAAAAIEAALRTTTER